MSLVQVAQHATDLDRAAAFTTEVPGTPPTASFDPPGLVFFDLDGVRLLLDRAAPSALISLAVPDITASIRSLNALGMPVRTPPHVIFSHDDDASGPAGTDEWQTFVEDPDGNLVGLVEHRRH